MDMGYNHHNNLKDFGAGYALVKKDQASLNVLLNPRLTGLEFLAHGLQALLSSSLTSRQ